MGNCFYIEKSVPVSEEMSSKQVKVRFQEPENKQNNHPTKAYEEYLFKLQRSRTGAHEKVCT